MQAIRNWRLLISIYVAGIIYLVMERSSEILIFSKGKEIPIIIGRNSDRKYVLSGNKLIEIAKQLIPKESFDEKTDVKDDSFLSKIFISYEGTFSL